MSAAGYAARLAGWAARHGARADSVQYARPAAEGDTAALRLTPEGGARTRAVVVHGAGNDAVFPLLELFRALLDAGVEVFSFDVDGHGTGSTTVFTADGVRSAVAAAVAEAERGAAPLPLHLVGHSLGGALVLDALAAGAAPHAAGAVVLSTPLQVKLGPATVATELAGFFRPATLSQRAHYGLWGVVPAFGPVKRAAYPFRRRDADGRTWGYVDAVRALLDEMRLPERAASVAAPTLLVYSRGDRLSACGDGERLAAALPRAELLRISGASHYGVAFHPEAVAQTARWIADYAPETP